MRAGTLAIIAGALLLLAGAGTSTLLFDAIGDFITDHWPDASGVIEWILQAISFLAALGGIAIIVGGILMLMGLERAGRLVVVIAAICAMVALIAQFIILLDRGEGDAGWWVDIALWVSVLGVFLAFRAKPERA